MSAIIQFIIFMVIVIVVGMRSEKKKTQKKAEQGKRAAAATGSRTQSLASIIAAEAVARKKPASTASVSPRGKKSVTQMDGGLFSDRRIRIGESITPLRERRRFAVTPDLDGADEKDEPLEY